MVKCYLVASLTLGDGHVRHQVPVVSVPQRRRPPAHDDLARPEAGEDRPGGDDRAEGPALLLEGEEPGGEGVLLLLLGVQPQHVLALLLLPLVGPGPGLGLYQPHGLHVGDPLLQLELHQGEDLEGDPAVDKGLDAVDALVSPGQNSTELSPQMSLNQPVVHQRVCGGAPVAHRQQLLVVVVRLRLYHQGGQVNVLPESPGYS